jgi:hypothetical protein
MLSLELAAAYMGVSPSHFEREVEAGKHPPCLRSGERKLWDRHQLDEWQDRATMQAKIYVVGKEETEDELMRRLRRGAKESGNPYKHCP